MRILDSQRGSLSPDVWDEMVESSPDGHLLQTCAWGELKASFGWKPVRLAVEQDGILVAGVQVLYRNYGPLSIGYIPKGPVVLNRDSDVIAALWNAVDVSARGRRSILTKIEPEWRDAEINHRLLGDWGFVPSAQTVQPRRTIMVDLQGSEDEILSRMKPKWRYNIRLSIRKEVVVRDADASWLPVFHDLMRVTGERDLFGIHSALYFRRAFELFAPLGRAKLFMATYHDQPLAGLMVFCFNRQAWYMYGASTDAHRNLMPNHQLQWRAMQWAKSVGCDQYDLWGIADADEDPETAALGGVQRFKLGFGGEVVRFVGAYDRVHSRSLYWVFQRAMALRSRSA